MRRKHVSVGLALVGVLLVALLAVAAVLVPDLPGKANLSIGTVVTLGALGLSAIAALGAATTFGAVSGPWDQASLWSNGVPTSTLSAIVSSTSGIPVLPALTSATTKNLTGGGSIGLAGGNINIFTIVSPSASTVVRLVPVDAMENATQSTSVPKGHA